MAPEEHGTGNKRQRQESADEGEEEKNKGEGRFVPEWDKGLPLDRKETDMAHRQMVAYKGI